MALSQPLQAPSLHQGTSEHFSSVKVPGHSKHSSKQYAHEASSSCQVAHNPPFHRLHPIAEDNGPQAWDHETKVTHHDVHNIHSESPQPVPTNHQATSTRIPPINRPPSTGHAIYTSQHTQAHQNYTCEASYIPDTWNNQDGEVMLSHYQPLHVRILESEDEMEDEFDLDDQNH